MQPVGIAPPPPLHVTVGLLNPLSGGTWDTPEIASAAKLAVEHINNDTSLLGNVELHLVVHDSACDADAGPEAASRLMQAGVDVILGAACSIVCE